MHIELTEMVRCPEPHEEGRLVLSTGEIMGRMVRSGILGCPVCRREFLIVKGVVHFSGKGEEGRVGAGPADAPTLQALLDLSGPGGYVVLIGSAARHAVGLAGLIGGIHFVGVHAPAEVEELPILSLLACDTMVPLRRAMARAVVVGREAATAAWLAEAQRVLLRGRRLVIEDDKVKAPDGVKQLAAAQGLWVGEKS